MSSPYRGRGRANHNGRPARFQQQRNNFRRGNNRAQRIDVSKYINQAVEVQPEEEYVTTHTFEDFGLSPELQANVSAHGYTTPTPIQDQAIPALMAGKDVVGIANTGTGKTAAFLLPLIDKVCKDSQQGVLILAPTRELAVQIYDELGALTGRLPIDRCLCIGGTSINNQVAILRKNPHFVIATPGRLKDLLNRGAFKTDLFRTIVLDEVDRMLDIGFRADILFLISKLPAEKHAALFSATIDRETEEIMRTFLVDPEVISVRKRETSNQVHQDIVRISAGMNKITVLHELLQQQEFERVIIFGRTKRGINKLERELYDRGIRVSSVHGNKSQNARQRSLQMFKQGRVQALLATDIASRGIDVEGVTHVINFDEPETHEDYIHRIGRTGRAGKMGKALTFVTG